MKVKVGNTITDGDHQPVMVILNDQDKKNIQNMHPDCTKYCVYPTNDYTPKEIIKWMKKE